MRTVGVVLLALLMVGCASLPVALSIVVRDATTCAIALATDAAAVAADPGVISLAAAPSIAGVLAVLTSLQSLMPDTILRCSPFVADVQEEFSGKVVAPSTPVPGAKLGSPSVPVPNPWKGMLRAGK